MASQPLGQLSEELQRLYKAVLLDIAHRLENDQKEELRFYYSDVIIPKADTGALNILRSLQHGEKISWKDLSILKVGLRVIQRWDLVQTLTAYEVNRDVILLLNNYARRRQSSELFWLQAFEPVQKVARYLVLVVADAVGDRFGEVSNVVGSLMQSRLETLKALSNFEEEIEKEMSDPWSKLTLLIAIAGETLASALANDERRERHQKEEVLKICFTMADKLSSKMIKLGSWEDFSNFVEKRYNLIYTEENSVLDADCLNSKRKIAGVIQLFKKSSFFSSTPKFGSTQSQNAKVLDN